MRRIIGIIGFIFSAICIYQLFWNERGFDKWIEVTVGDGLMSGLIRLFTSLSIILIWGFLYMIFNVPFHYVLLSGRRGEVSEYSNINDFIKYRNGIMGGMSPEKSAKLMNDTAVIDQLVSGGYGSNTKDTMKYINGRLGGLSPDNQILFLRGEKK